MLPSGLRKRVPGSTHRVSWQRQYAGWLFILPWILGFIFLDLLPYLAALVLSMMKWNIASDPKWVGLDNFRALWYDDMARISLWNTAYYTLLHVPGTTIIAFAVAGLLNQKVKGLPVYRTLFYIPSVTSGVGMALIWIWMLAPNGVVNSFLGWFGIQGPHWLADPNWAMPALILMSFWGMGASMIIFLAGFQGVPEHLYEAAEVDGAGWLAKVRHVTIPMMTPYIFLVMILGVISSFQVVTQALLMTEGGPDNSTLFVLLYIWETAWVTFRMGYAAAFSWVLFVIILVATGSQFLLARRWVYYEYRESL